MVRHFHIDSTRSHDTMSRWLDMICIPAHKNLAETPSHHGGSSPQAFSGAQSILKRPGQRLFAIHVPQSDNVEC